MFLFSFHAAFVDVTEREKLSDTEIGTTAWSRQPPREDHLQTGLRKMPGERRIGGKIDDICFGCTDETIGGKEKGKSTKRKGKKRACLGKDFVRNILVCMLVFKNT